MHSHPTHRSPFGLRAALLCLVTTFSACEVGGGAGKRPVALLTAEELASNGVSINGTQLNTGGSQQQGVNLNTGGSQQQGVNMNTGGSQQQGDALNGPRLRLEGHFYEGATLGGTPVGTLRIEAGELVAEQDGVVIRGEALEGMEVVSRIWDDATQPATEQREVHRVTAVTPAPFGEGESFVYSVERRDGAGRWQPLCDPDLQGNTWAVPVAATWSSTAAREESEGLFTFACTSGAIGKCYAWGYRPWDTHPEGADLMKQAHQACVRLARADFCGDGRAHTRTGTTIMVWDTLADGPQDWERLPGMSLEAAWTPDGAKCVQHPRWRELGERIEVRCGERVLPKCSEEDRAASLAPTPGAPRLFTESRLQMDLTAHRALRGELAADFAERR